MVDTGSVAKGKSGRQHNEKKYIELEAKRRKHCELLVFLYLFLPYFVKISEESIRKNKIKLSVLDTYFIVCFSSSMCFVFATGKSETWKKSYYERDPSVRDIFPYVGCLIIGAGNERRKGILRVP